MKKKGRERRALMKNAALARLAERNAAKAKNRGGGKTKSSSSSSGGCVNLGKTISGINGKAKGLAQNALGKVSSAMNKYSSGKTMGRILQGGQGKYNLGRAIGKKFTGR